MKLEPTKKSPGIEPNKVYLDEDVTYDVGTQPPKENHEVEYDFDFSRYEEEEKLMEDAPAFENPEDYKPRKVMNIKSRWDNSLRELQRMADIGDSITKYSLLVEARTPDINLLWKYYGILSEFWECMRHIHGENLQGYMDKLRNDALDALKRNRKSKDKIDDEVYDKLLTLRQKLYRYKQFSNLGFTVESKNYNRGANSRAKRQITE